MITVGTVMLDCAKTGASAMKVVSEDNRKLSRIRTDFVDFRSFENDLAMMNNLPFKWITSARL